MAAGLTTGACCVAGSTLPGSSNASRSSSRVTRSLYWVSTPSSPRYVVAGMRAALASTRALLMTAGCCVCAALQGYEIQLADVADMDDVSRFRGSQLQFGVGCSLQATVSCCSIMVHPSCRGSDRRVSSFLTCMCCDLQEPSSAPKQPVEFDQAINYVNKIKVTAAGSVVQGGCQHSSSVLAKDTATAAGYATASNAVWCSGELQGQLSCSCGPTQSQHVPTVLAAVGSTCRQP